MPGNGFFVVMGDTLSRLRGQFGDLPVQRRYAGEYFRIVQQRGFPEHRLELVHEVDQSARALNTQEELQQAFRELQKGTFLKS